MKRILSIFLGILMTVSMLSLLTFGSAADDADAPEEEASLPANCTLVGSPYLPPIGNQGEVGCCASMAITYMQFTNAVSRYIREYEPEKTFEPATGDERYIFSPKWTYTLSGSGTAWVYDILVTQGCPTMDRSNFVYSSGTKAFSFHKVRRPTRIEPTAVRWDIGNGNMEDALHYRLTNYDQIWINDSFAVNGKINLTSSEKGQALIERIKRSLTEGNAVVTGGFSSAWQYVDTLSGKGTLARSKRESALVCALGSKAGGHQLCIVGYDDEIKCKYKGVTLTGAFLVANSWGTDWMNDGYVWLMYDALNEVSDHSELNADNRVISMDQFCFVDWRTDVSSGMPKLYFEVDVAAEDRESILILPARKDADGRAQTFKPYMFVYDRYHPKFDIKDTDYLTVDGELNGELTRSTFVFDYRELASVPEGGSISDYTFGASVGSKKGPVYIYGMRLKNEFGTVLSELDFGEEGVRAPSNSFYYFNDKVCSLDIDRTDLENIVPAAIEGDYAAGGVVSICYTIPEGYTDEELKITANGAEIPRNSDGSYTLIISEDVVLRFEGVKEIPQPDPVGGDETPGVPSSASQAPAINKNGVNPGVLAAVICGSAALSLGAALLIIKLAGKKKQ